MERSTDLAWARADATWAGWEKKRRYIPAQAQAVGGDQGRIGVAVGLVITVGELGVGQDPGLHHLGLGDAALVPQRPQLGAGNDDHDGDLVRGKSARPVDRHGLDERVLELGGGDLDRFDGGCRQGMIHRRGVDRSGLVSGAAGERCRNDAAQEQPGGAFNDWHSHRRPRP